MSSTDTYPTVSEKVALDKKGYKLIKKLNSGSFANVYLAEYTPNESDNPIILACKIVNYKKLIKEKILSQKFIHRELLILPKLNHPYLISVQRILQWYNKYYIFMPYAEKGDLLEYIRGNKEMIPEEQCRIWFRQLSLGVQYIHEMEIAHRDIKCENILLTAEMNLKLADFGFARYVIDETTKQVLSNTFCGSANYIAPEVVINIPYDPKVSDMWSMGIILFTMLNKLMPFKADETPYKLHRQQMQRRYTFRNILFSEQAKFLVNNLLEPDVAQRWTVAQVLNCEWFTMDPPLTELSLEEQEALNNAITKRKKREEKLKNKQKQSETKETLRMEKDNAGVSNVDDYLEQQHSDELSIVENTVKIDMIVKQDSVTDTVGL